MHLIFKYRHRFKSGAGLVAMTCEAHESSIDGWQETSKCSEVLKEQAPLVARKRLSRPRRLLFGITAVALGIVVATALAEWALRSRQTRMLSSDHLTPGLSRFDPYLGWAPTPHWTGRHQHHDFDVSYTMNGIGFRGDDVRNHKQPAKLTTVVGDSFTFGTGVNDDETFVALLDRRGNERERFYNFAVPGFSTDQELLLVEREVLRWHPDRLLLVVYLGNDLFDNQLPISLQVNKPKPLFVLSNGVLLLTNSPISSLPVDRRGQPSMREMIVGKDGEQKSWILQMETRSYVARALGETFLAAPNLSTDFNRRFDYGLSLFWALVQRMQQSCNTNGTRFVVALISGRSFVENPDSLSGQYQDFFRRHILQESLARKIAVIDLAAQLQQRYRSERTALFHRNEGHLNAMGHRTVAEILDTTLSRAGAAATRAGPTDELPK